MPSGCPVSKEVISRIYMLRKQGKTLQQIAEILALGRSTVYHHSSPEKWRRCQEIMRQRRELPGYKKRVKGYHRQPEVQRRKRDYRRQNSLVVNSKRIKVVKRKRPDSCELCSRVVPKLDWHHWDDFRPGQGLWLCWGCHHFAEGVERGLHMEDYLRIKEKFSVPIEVEIETSTYWR